MDCKMYTVRREKFITVPELFASVPVDPVCDGCSGCATCRGHSPGRRARQGADIAAGRYRTDESGTEGAGMDDSGWW